MVATAATMAAMPAGNAAVFYDWRNYNEAGGIHDTRGSWDVYHLGDMNDRVSSIRSWGERYVAYQDANYKGLSFDINYRDFNSLEGFYEGRNWWNGDWNDKITSLRRIK